MNSFRMEHDSLGKVKVPKNALYGAQTVRAVHNFPISGRTMPPALIRAFLRIKAAAAQANFKAGVIDSQKKTLIIAATREILALPEHDWSGVFPVDAYQAGAGTS